MNGITPEIGAEVQLCGEVHECVVCGQFTTDPDECNKLGDPVCFECLDDEHKN